MPATNASTLFSETRCFACLPVSSYELLKLAILNRFMAAVPMQTLMDEAKCYQCFGPLTDAQMLTLALLRRWVLTLDAAAAVDAQSLVTYATCFTCTGLSMFETMELALLDMISQLS